MDSVLRKLGDNHGDIARFCFSEVVQHISDRLSYQLLLALSFSPVSFDRVALGQITNLSNMDRDDSLVELEKLSLITKRGERFFMLPLTRTFSSHELEHHSELHKLLRARWVAYFMEFSRGLRKQNHRLEATDPDLANISEAIEWCWENQSHRAFLQLIDYSHALFWNAENWVNLVSYYERGLQAAAELKDELMEALILRWHADIFDFQDNPVEAEKKANQAINLFRKLGENKHQVIAIYRLTSVYRKQKMFDEAYKATYEGLEISEKLGDAPLLLSMYGRLAMLSLDEELLEKAQDYLDKAWEVQKALPDHERETWRVANIYTLMGRVSFKKGKYDQSITHLNKAIELGKISLVPQAVAEAQWALVEPLLGSGLLDEAQRNLDEAANEFDRLGMRRYAELRLQVQARIDAAHI
jgi:tetratricopeptide (TPR) repeat protein